MSHLLPLYYGKVLNHLILAILPLYHYGKVLYHLVILPLAISFWESFISSSYTPPILLWESFKYFSVLPW